MSNNTISSNEQQINKKTKNKLGNLLNNIKLTNKNTHFNNVNNNNKIKVIKVNNSKNTENDLYNKTKDDISQNISTETNFNVGKNTSMGTHNNNANSNAGSQNNAGTNTSIGKSNNNAGTNNNAGSHNNAGINNNNAGKNNNAGENNNAGLTSSTLNKTIQTNNNLNNNNNIQDTTINTTLENVVSSSNNVSKYISNNIMNNLNKLTMNLFNHQIVLKLFHFQTSVFGAHKASDEYLEKFALIMDKFLEIAQGIYGKITLKKYTLTGSSHTDENIIKHIDGMIILLREKINDVLNNNTDLINIRDELVGNAEQLKYLLAFK